jgi:hypothetical protein
VKTSADWWLQGYLAHGGDSVERTYRDARRAGFKDWQVDRAVTVLGVRTDHGLSGYPQFEYLIPKSKADAKAIGDEPVRQMTGGVREKIDGAHGDGSAGALEAGDDDSPPDPETEARYDRACDLAEEIGFTTEHWNKLLEMCGLADGSASFRNLPPAGQEEMIGDLEKILADKRACDAGTVKKRGKPVTFDLDQWVSL